MPWRSPQELLRRYKLHRKSKKQQKKAQQLPRLDTASQTPTEDKKDPIVEFSRKEIVLKTSTPVKPGANRTIALEQYQPSVDLWTLVDEDRREIATRNQRESPFLRLPAEVRNKIYDAALGGRTYKFKDAIYRDHATLETNGERHVLGLLLVCHQIYSEASLLPYSLNTFSFREFELSFKPFLDHRRLAHFRAITSIELVTYQAARMWASPHYFSDIMKEVEETKVWARLPNLREIRVVVDLNTSLYVEYGTRDFNFTVIRESQRSLEEEISAIRPLVLVRFFWA